MTIWWVVLTLIGAVMVLSRPARDRREAPAVRRSLVRHRPVPAPVRMELIGAVLDAGLPVSRALAVVAEAEGSQRMARAAERFALGLSGASHADPPEADPAREEASWGKSSKGGGRRVPHRRGLRGDAPSGRGREGREVAHLSRVLDFAVRTGSPAARMLRAEALASRRRARRDAEKRASSLGVRLVLPLGLCSLPALICLGVLPVVIGLFSSLAL